MGNKIQVKRGNEVNLPVLSNGELGVTLDSKKMFFGTPGGNVEVAKKLEVDAQLAETATDLGQRGVNVLSFGTLPDGITDNTKMFQDAINYLISKGGGELIIPRTANPYTLIANNPTIQSPKRILINGDNIHIKGVGKPIIQMKGMTKAYLDSINDKNSSGRDVFTVFSFMRSKKSGIKGVHFTGEWDGVGFFRYQSPRAKAVGFLGTEDCYAEDLYGSGILGNLVNASPSDFEIDGEYKPLKGIAVRNSYATKCLENGFNYMGNTFDGVFEGNTVTYCGSTGFEAATNNLSFSNNLVAYNKIAGMSISAVNYTGKGNIASNNTNNGEHASSPATGIQLTTGSSGVLSDNLIYGNESFGLYGYPGVKKVKMINNILRDNGTKTSQTSVINFVGSSANLIEDIELSGNRIENTLSHMAQVVNFSYVKNSNIFSNNVKSVSGLSIYVQGSCDNVRVFDNEVDRAMSISTSAPNCVASRNAGASPKQVELTAPPTIGTWTKGDLVLNSWVGMASGSPTGWRCTTSGVANNTAWASNTTYALGTIVNTGNKVYKATVAGTSSTTAPSHTTGTATDGTVTWEYLGALAKFDVAGQAGVLTSISSVPAFIGQFAVVGGIGYMATGISTTADWKQITN